MENVNKQRILSFEQFVAGGQDSEMDQSPSFDMHADSESMPEPQSEMPGDSEEPADLNLMDEPNDEQPETMELSGEEGLEEYNDSAW